MIPPAPPSERIAACLNALREFTTEEIAAKTFSVMR